MGSDTASQSQKKCTLEALERRFSVAKAELIQQQKKTQNENNNTTNSISSIAPPVHLPPAPSIHSCLNSSLKKGSTLALLVLNSFSLCLYVYAFTPM